MPDESHPKPDAVRLQRHLAAIAKPRDPFANFETLQEIQSYIERELCSYGYETRKDPFQFQGREFENLIAYIPSGRLPRNPQSESRHEEPSRFIIGSHFDAVPGTDGADDNASGMAALLEAARLLAGTHAARRIDFLAFNLEEYGMIGSSHYVAGLKTPGAKSAGMISLEMVGFTSQEKGSQKMPLVLRPFYPDVGNFLALVGDTSSKDLLKKAKPEFQKVSGLAVETLSVPAKGWIFPETRLSDHSPFWDAGIPALLVTDTSFFRNPHYHTPADRVETLNLEFLARVTEDVVHFALSLE